MNTFIQQESIKLIKINKLIMLQQIYISNKRCSFKIFTHHSILSKVHQGFHKNIKQNNMFSTLIIIRNVS